MVFDPALGRVVPRNVNLTVLGGWQIRTSGLHPALDIPLVQGTPIFAAADGVVSRVSPTNSSDAGIFVALTHPSGLVSRYLHLSQALVTQGQRVTQGQQIGLSGNTGLSEGPHLHFDLSVPATLLPAIEAAVGKPSTGFSNDFGFGTGIPSEPWLPVDSYASSVIANARALGIPLFKDRPKPVVTAAAPAGAGRNVIIGIAVVGSLAGLGWLALHVAKHAAVALGRRQQRTRHGRGH